MTPGRLAASLKALRKFHGWSQGEVARRSGLTQSHISMIESGDRGCTDHVAEALAAAFDVSAADLRAGKCGHCGGSPRPGYACGTCGRRGPACSTCGEGDTACTGVPT